MTTYTTYTYTFKFDAATYRIGEMGVNSLTAISATRRFSVICDVCLPGM